MKTYLPIMFTILCLTAFFGCSDTSQKDYDEYKIEYYFELKKNNHVGTDWSHKVFYNNTTIRSGDIIKLKKNTDLDIKAEICELDNHNDIGKASIILNTKTKTSDTVEIKVREKDGRYKGNTAIWLMYCTLTKK